jgi:hypothetical protein
VFSLSEFNSPSHDKDLEAVSCKYPHYVYRSAQGLTFIYSARLSQVSIVDCGLPSLRRCTGSTFSPFRRYAASESGLPHVRHESQALGLQEGLHPYRCRDGIAQAVRSSLREDRAMSGRLCVS